MSIKSYIEELDKIKKDIELNNKKNVILRKRKKHLENQIKDYLSANEQHGVKYNNNKNVIMMQTVKKQKLLKKKDRESNVINYLYDIGVRNPEKAFEEMQKIQRHNETETRELKIKKLK